MGWFDKQIREVKQNDQKAFEDSILQMAAVVLNDKKAEKTRDERIVTREVADVILKYYGFTPVDVPQTVKDADEALEYCLRPHGVMRRDVELKEKWYNDGFGPLLVYNKSDGAPVFLRPGSFRGYWYFDPKAKIWLKVTKRKAETFSPDAICFYKPLPARSLQIKDLGIYIGKSISEGDRIRLILLTVIAAVIGMLTPYITRFMTGFVLESGRKPILLATAAFMLSVIVSQQLINVIKNLIVTRIQAKGSVSVKSALMMRLINLPASFFGKYSSGELANRFNYISALSDTIIRDVGATGVASLMSLIYIAQIANFTPALAVPAVIVILATVIVSVVAGLMQMKVSKKVMLQSSKTSGLTFAIINGVQKIKLSGAEKRAFAKWSEMYTQQANTTYNISACIKLSKAITMAITLAGTIAMYLIAVNAKVSPSEYIAFNSAYGLVTGAFATLSGVALTIAKIRPIYEMVEPILLEEPESTSEKTVVTSVSGNIELSNVYFRYKESMPYVVDGMSLKIKAGEYIALVGTTGCGKSTLMRLLLGFEKPERGAIYYDGKDMSKLDLRSLRRRIGAVTQDGKLFQGDLYSNILISAPQLPKEAAWEAAEIAGIADDIRAMPMKMHTVVGEGQGGISGGQKQRLMIARAIAPKPRILMFDEATSALDNRTQKQVSEALDRMNCTRIVIAHRLSTIKNCDRILMLDKGHIVEDGTYDELIAKNGRFAELVARQRIDSND